MTPDIQTIHRKKDGEQVTERHVTVTDATGEEYTHRWRVEDGDHEYLGDGDAPTSAVEALAEDIETFDAPADDGSDGG